MKWMRRISGPIVKGTIRTSIVFSLRLIVQAGTLLLVARVLGPNQFGAFAGVASLAVMAGSLATFGMHLILLGEVSKDPARRTQVLLYALPTTFLCGLILLAVYLGASRMAIHDSSISASTVWAIGIAETLLQPLLGLQAAEHMALGRIARSQLLQMLPLALRLVAAVAVFGFNSGDALAAYGYGYLLASMVALIIGTICLPAPWPPPRAWRAPPRAVLREASGYASLTITTSSPAELDKTLAAKLLPLSAAGLYAAGARIIGATTLPIVAMMFAALPRLFREGRDQPRRTAHLLRLIFSASLGYSVVLAIALWFAAPLFLTLFGSRYAGIEHAIHWLCLAVPGIALRMAAGNALMALGKPWARVGFEVTGLMVLVIAAIVLTNCLGANGMPLALACSEWAMSLLGWSLVRKAAVFNVKQEIRHAA